MMSPVYNIETDTTPAICPTPAIKAVGATKKFKANLVLVVSLAERHGFVHQMI